MTLLLLIRHGTNDWVHGRLAGWTPGVHLNAEGQLQAAALSERLADLPIAAVYSSPLERCMETATIVAQPRAMVVDTVVALGEVEYGEWQGAALQDLSSHALWPGVQFYPSGTRFPGGETLGEAQVRVVQALDHLRAQHPRQLIAVFSHADMIKLAVAYYVGIHIDLFQRLTINPCSLTALAFEPMGPRLLALNDCGSLGYLRLAPEESAPAGASDTEGGTTAGGPPVSEKLE